MILTVTCNPAVDKTYNASGVMIGQVNRMRDLVSLPGGKGINVTKVLNQFGVPVTATGFLGGYPGDFIESALQKMNVATEFTKIRNMTRSNMNIIGDDGYVTEILEPGPYVAAFEKDQFLDNFRRLAPQSECVVMSGSLTDGLPENFYAKLIGICQEADVKVFLDTSGEPLKRGIEQQPYCIKPNRKELEYVTGRKLSTEAEVIQAAYAYVKAGISKVVVSMGDKGLLEISKHKVIKAVPPRIKAVNTVGSGDCVVAALVLGMVQGLGEEDTMQLAAGISAANATTLESGMVPRDTMDELVQNVSIVTM
jgi:tagatose 6-phosphate kinase